MEVKVTAVVKRNPGAGADDGPSTGFSSERYADGSLEEVLMCEVVEV